MKRIIAAALLFIGCSGTSLPTECEPSTEKCDNLEIEKFYNYCGGEAVKFVRPDVCTSYPFGEEYAGAFYCEGKLLEAWCAE